MLRYQIVLLAYPSLIHVTHTHLNISLVCRNVKKAQMLFWHSISFVLITDTHDTSLIKRSLHPLRYDTISCCVIPFIWPISTCRRHQFFVRLEDKQQQSTIKSILKQLLQRPCYKNPLRGTVCVVFICYCIIIVNRCTEKTQALRPLMPCQADFCIRFRQKKILFPGNQDTFSQVVHLFWRPERESQSLCMCWREDEILMMNTQSPVQVLQAVCGTSR